MAIAASDKLHQQINRFGLECRNAFPDQIGQEGIVKRYTLHKTVAPELRIVQFSYSWQIGRDDRVAVIQQ